MYDLSRLQILISDEISPAYRTQLKCLEPFYHKIEKAFNFEFVDALLTAQIKLNSIDADETFIQGLRLGAQLTLSLFFDNFLSGQETSHKL